MAARHGPKRLIGAVGGNAGLMIAQKLLRLAAAVFLARQLGVEDYGFYTFAISAALLIALPSQLGLPQLVTRETARKGAKGDWRSVAQVRRHALVTSLTVSFLGMAIVGGALLLFSAFIQALDPLTFLLALLVLPFEAVAGIFSGLLRGFKRVLHASWPANMLQPGVFLMLILITGTTTSSGAAALGLVASAMAAFMSYLLLRRYWPIADCQVERRWPRREWIVSLLPFSLIAGINLVNQRTDVLMLGFLTTASDVGIYNVALQGALLAAFPLAAVNPVLSPQITSLHAKGDNEGLQRLLGWSTLGILLISAIVALVFATMGEWLIELAFGTEYTKAHRPLTILVLGQLANAAAGPVGQFLTMSGYEKTTLTVVAISAGLNVLLNALLIPLHGTGGAAAATAISLAFLNLLLCFQLYRRMGLVAGPFGMAIRRNDFRGQP